MVRRTQYQEELKRIVENVVEMGDLVIESLNRGLKSLIEMDKDLAVEVIADDEKIDNKQLLIEDRVTLLIAKETPIATDLREVLTILKIIVELERLGDHGKHLAERAGKVSKEGLRAATPFLTDMTNLGCQMVKEALESFRVQDSEWAMEIAKRDSYIDDKYVDLYNKIIEIIKEKPNKTENLVPLLFLNRYLERIGDRVTNICEAVVYTITSKHTYLN